jgi:hypothetical protein
MNIFCIMLIKDEADVIRFTLREGRKWADRIFVLDNGSTDGTWEIVREMADDVIVPWKQDLQPYSNPLRGEVFRAFFPEARPGDWWCYKMDADEVYVDDPRAFLAGVPRLYDTVFKKSVDYVITHEDLDAGIISESAEENLPRLRYYKSPAWTEPRFIRHAEGMTWREGAPAPRRPGTIYPRTIAVRHYQFRTPEQMQRRLDVRRSKTGVKQDGKAFHHVTQSDWRELLMSRSQLVFDSGKGSEEYRDLPLRRKLAKPLAVNLLKILRFRLMEAIGR